MKLSDKEIENLHLEFLRFVEATEYREEELFYTPHHNNIIELSYNENPFGPGAKAKAAMDRFKDYIHLYPPVGLSLLRSSIAAQLQLHTNQIIIGNGSLGIINSGIRLAAGKGDHVIYSKSSIPMYRWAISSNGSIPNEIPLQGDYHHDLQRIIDAITDKTKAIIIDNPHNPTGLYISPDTILNAIKAIPESILVIIDQAYIEYADDHINEAIIASFNTFPNVLITRTFSKIHALAGLRVGYGIAHSNLIKKLNAENLGNIGSVGLLPAFVANASFNDLTFIEESKQKNKIVLEDVAAGFRELYDDILKTATNFICIRTASSQEFNNQISSNIKVTGGDRFGYPELVRISTTVNFKR